MGNIVTSDSSRIFLDSMPPFERRMYDRNAPVIKNPDGTVSSHKLAWGEDEKGYYVFPTVMMVADSLIEVPDFIADSIARKNGNIKRFKTRKEAEAFAGGSWKKVVERYFNTFKD